LPIFYYVPEETVMSTGYLDTTDTLQSSSTSRWGKFGPRRLLHYVCQILRDVWSEANESRKPFWEESFFLEILATSMEGRSSSINVETRFILWNTDPSRFIRYDRLRPIIVARSQDQDHLPTSKRRKVSSSNFQFKPGKVGRNMFFRWLNIGKVQINDILFGRIIQGIHHKYPQGQNKTVQSWKAHYKQIKTKKKLNLGILWPSEDAFMKNMSEFKKKTKAKFEESMVVRYEVNKSQWKYHSDGDIELFTYPKIVENKMNKFLSKQTTWRQAIMFAENGFVTEPFLDWLIEMKKIYNEGNKADNCERKDFFSRANLDFLERTGK
jgi:hypothetical protein